MVHLPDICAKQKLPLETGAALDDRLPCFVDALLEEQIVGWDVR